MQRRSSLLVIAILATLAFGSGCYHAVIRAGGQAGIEQTRTGWNLFWGIADANFDISDCPSGVAYAEVWRPWWGFIPEFITLGIASPQRLAYVCSAPAGSYGPPPPPPR